MLCQLSYTRSKNIFLSSAPLPPRFNIWAEQDSNLRRDEVSPDLQSGAIGRSAICPIVLPPTPDASWGSFYATGFIFAWKLAVGVEPTTSGLQNRCSAIELR